MNIDPLVPRPYLEESDWTHHAPPLVTIVFPKYRGRSYPQARLTGRQAEVYREYIMENALYHVAAFAQTRHQAATALALIMLTVGIKGTLVFGSDGILVPNRYQAEGILECYQKACLVKDYRAYCYSVINDPFVARGSFEMLYTRDRTVDRYVLPCRPINPTYLKFEGDHPSRPEDLMQAAAVHQGCHWCPNFSAESFRRVDSERPHEPHQEIITE